MILSWYELSFTRIVRKIGKLNNDLALFILSYPFGRELQTINNKSSLILK